MNKTAGSNLNPYWKQKVLQVEITALEGALLKKVREIEFGEITMKIVKNEGQPIRIEVVSEKKSLVLNGNDGLNLAGAVYIPPTKDKFMREIY